MDREVAWTESAARDLEQIAEFIAQDSEHYAATVVRAILEAAESLSRLSERGTQVPEYRDPAIRELFVWRYRLMYQVTAARVHVLGVIHGSRDFVP